MIFSRSSVQVVLPNGRHHSRVPAERAESMLIRGEVIQVGSARAMLVVQMRSSNEPLEERGKLRHPHAVTPKHVASSHGDAGLTRTHGYRTLHISIGQSNAGLPHAVSHES